MIRHITDQQVRDAIANVKARFDDGGMRHIVGELRRHNLLVQLREAAQQGIAEKNQATPKRDLKPSTET